MKVCAIIPAFNEASTIQSVIQRTKRHVKNIVVVDDGSNDSTRQIAQQERVTVVHHHKNMGLGRSITDGVDRALHLKADIIVQLDGDGQHNPDEIPTLLEPILDGGADVVVGSRFLEGGDTSMPAIKRMGNRIFSSLLSKMCGARITDSQSGFRAYKSEVIRDINLISSFSYTQEFLFHAYQNGFRIKEIPIAVEKREHGKSKVVRNIIGYTTRQLLTLFRIYRDYEPLKTFSMISLFFFLFGIIFGFVAFIQKAHQMILGLTGLLLIILSIQLFFFGFLADMAMNVKKEFFQNLRRR
jgi:glycosyltransferase involved in cell wall biosynthesis